MLSFALPFFESGQVRDADKSRDAAVGLVLDVRAAHNPRQVERIIEDLRPSVMPILKARLAPPDSKGGGSLSVSGKRLPPLAPIALGSSGALPGAMPPGASSTIAEDGEEVMAYHYHGTPPDAQSRARARSTATELGVRNAPPPKKKAAKRPTVSPGGKKSPPIGGNVAHDIADDDILAEASNLLADMPAPRRMAAPKAHDTPSRTVRDENMTEEQLMASIMDESLS